MISSALPPPPAPNTHILARLPYYTNEHFLRAHPALAGVLNGVLCNLLKNENDIFRGASGRSERENTFPDREFLQHLELVKYMGRGWGISPAFPTRPSQATGAPPRRAARRLWDLRLRPLGGPLRSPFSRARLQLLTRAVTPAFHQGAAARLSRPPPPPAPICSLLALSFSLSVSLSLFLSLSYRSTMKACVPP